MSSAINHARRSHRSYAVHQNIAGTAGKKTWIKQQDGRTRKSVGSRWRELVRMLFRKKGER